MEVGFPCRKNITSNGNEDCALLLNVVLEVSAWSWGARPGDLLLLVSVSFEPLLGSVACPFGKILGVVGAMFCKVKEPLASHVWLSAVATGLPSNSHPLHTHQLQLGQPGGYPASSLGSPEVIWSVLQM